MNTSDYSISFGTTAKLWQFITIAILLLFLASCNSDDEGVEPNNSETFMKANVNGNRYETEFVNVSFSDNADPEFKGITLGGIKPLANNHSESLILQLLIDPVNETLNPTYSLSITEDCLSNVGYCASLYYVNTLTGEGAGLAGSRIATGSELSITLDNSPLELGERLSGSFSGNISFPDNNPDQVFLVLNGTFSVIIE